MYDHHSLEFTISQDISLADFILLYKTFCYAPYNEEWSDDDIKQVYDVMMSKGVIYGIYDKLSCAGIITLTDQEHPLDFEEKVLFIADIAVSSKYRKYNVTDKLLDVATAYAKDNNYKIVYLRTLDKDNSLDYEAFKNKGFKKINDKCQVVKMKRTKRCKDEDCRIFMRRDIG